MRGFPSSAALSGILLAGVLFACTPHENPPPVSGTVALFRILEVDTGGPVTDRKTRPVLAVHLRLVNPGAEVRLLGYRYETARGIVSEALMNTRLMEESRSRLGRLVRFGLPTVFPAGSTSDGWVFFRTRDTKGRIRLSLRDVYGRFSSLYIPLPGEGGTQNGPKAAGEGGGPASAPPP